MTDPQLTPQQHAQRELALRELSRRRLMQFIQRFNPRYLPGWVHEDICFHLEKFSRDVAEGKSPRLGLFMPPRAGKLLADDTPVPTPTGWKNHGDLQPGDEVFGPDGVPTRVLAVSAPAPADIRVETSRGEVFYTHEAHEWTFYDRGARKLRTEETSWLMRSNRGQRMLVSAGRCVYQLPTAAALQFSGPIPDMHPYVLGAWLGDGSCGKPCITHTAVKQPVIDKIVSLGYPVSTVCTHATTGVDTTYFSGPRPGVAGRMTQELQALGVYTEKDIPEAYQVAPTEARLELLAGLIDTDGSVCQKTGRITVSTAREPLARSILTLCEGLGLRPYYSVAEPVLSSSGIQGRAPVWTVGFQPTGPLPTVVPHKQVKRIAPQRLAGFIDIKHDPQGKVGRCIQVAREDGLYVVGRKLTVTHNSEIVSRNFPAWHLGQHPHHEYIACSYNLDLAITFSRKVKQIIEDPQYAPLFPQLKPDPNNWSASEWMLQNGGGYLAAGVGGGITGRGAHILSIDDPVKSAEEADSQLVLEKIWEWYGATAYTRLAPGGGVLLIQTCWSDLDLAGRIQQAMKDDPEFDQFTIVKYPAIAEEYEYRNATTRLITRSPQPLSVTEIIENDLELLREPGQALHPERYDEKKLAAIKRTLPQRFWNALYQQNPVPDDGAYFKGEWFRYTATPDRTECNVFQAWDFAISEKNSNDYTVGSCSLQDADDTLHFADMQRFRSGDAFQIVEAMLTMAKRWYNPSLIIGVEDGQIWRAIQALMYKRMRELRFYPTVQVLKPIQDKQARGRVLQGRMQQGKVAFPPPEQAPWVEPLRHEFLRFPAGVNDDIVDSCAWNAQLAVGTTPPRKTEPKKLKSWKDRVSGRNSSNNSHMAA